jgi:hypothetical protein
MLAKLALVFSALALAVPSLAFAHHPGKQGGGSNGQGGKGGKKHCVFSPCW